MSRILYPIAAELWLRKRESDIQRTLDGVARSMTLRLAEHLPQYISCVKQANWPLLTLNVCSATYWVKPILSELLGAADELPGPNKNRAASGPVKAVVSPTPHSQVVSGVTVVSRISALIAWFPVNWSSKIASLFQQGSAGSYQNVQKVYIQSVRRVPPPQSEEAGGEATAARNDGNLLAVRLLTIALRVRSGILTLSMLNETASVPRLRDTVTT